jgi:tRNA U55 pseudouridine synthase TruB
MDVFSVYNTQDMPVAIYKSLSETPLETIGKYRAQHPEIGDVKIGYAGRLDPMAEGLLLLLIGDENRNKKEFENLEKRRCRLLLGLGNRSIRHTHRPR